MPHLGRRSLAGGREKSFAPKFPHPLQYRPMRVKVNTKLPNLESEHPMEHLGGVFVLLVAFVIVVLVGAPFLFWGDKLFWLFSVLTGFVLGALPAFLLAAFWLPDFRLPDVYYPAGVIVIGLLTMGVFVMLSFYWRRAMTIVTALFAGGVVLVLHGLVFLTGGMLFLGLFALLLGGGYNFLLNWALILFLIGSIASAAVAWVSPIWARIMVSSLFGTLIIATGILPLLYGLDALVFQDTLGLYGTPKAYIVALALTIPLPWLGIVFQRRRMHKRATVSPYALNEPLNPL